MSDNLRVIEGDLTENLTHTGDLRVKGDIAEGVRLTVKTGGLHVDGSAGDKVLLATTGGKMELGGVKPGAHITVKGGDLHISGIVGEEAEVKVTSFNNLSVHTAQNGVNLYVAFGDITIDKAGNRVQVESGGSISIHSEIGDHAKIEALAVMAKQVGNDAEIVASETQIGTAGDRLKISSVNRFQADTVGNAADISSQNIDIGSLGDHSTVSHSDFRNPGKARLGTVGEGVVFRVGEVAIDGKPMEPTATMREARRSTAAAKTALPEWMR